MKLYCPPGPASLAPQIALQEAGLAVDLISVGPTPFSSAAARLEAMGPFAHMPALEFNDDLTLRSVPIILQFVADFAPKALLAPASGSLAALRVSEWLHFTADLFPSARCREMRRGAELSDRAVEIGLAWANLHVTPGGYLVSGAYSIADIYLWVMVDYLRRESDDPGHGGPFARRFPNLDQWYRRVADRHAVRIVSVADRAGHLPPLRLAQAR